MSEREEQDQDARVDAMGDGTDSPTASIPCGVLGCVCVVEFPLMYCAVHRPRIMEQS